MAFSVAGHDDGREARRRSSPNVEAVTSRGRLQGTTGGNDGNEPSGDVNKRFAFRGGGTAAGGGRILTSSDVVAIRIIDHPELDTTTRVEPDGTINFPYVGRIKAAGRSEDDLGRAVGVRLVELKIIAGP